MDRMWVARARMRSVRDMPDGVFGMLFLRMESFVDGVALIKSSLGVEER